MTTAQLQTLKTHINNNLNIVTGGETIETHISNTNYQAISDYYNSDALIQIWKSDIPASDITKSIVSSAFTALTAVKQNALLLYINGITIDATSQNVRDGFNNIFGAGATLTNLTNIAKRTATIFESLFIGAIQGAAYVSSTYNIIVISVDIQDALRS